MKFFYIFLVYIILSSCTTMIKDYDGFSDYLKGKPISEVINRYSLPSSKTETNGVKVYEFYESYGIITNSYASSSRSRWLGSSSSSSSVEYYCKLIVTINKDDIIKNVSWRGNRCASMLPNEYKYPFSPESDISTKGKKKKTKSNN